jgi:hypothetical protein
MLLSDFWLLLDHVFGSAYARTLARQLVLTKVGDRTAAQAIEDGVPPRDVWHALCDAMEVPESLRDGGGRETVVPPRR